MLEYSNLGHLAGRLGNGERAAAMDSTSALRNHQFVGIVLNLLCRRNLRLGLELPLAEEQVEEMDSCARVTIIHSFPLCIEWSLGLSEASVFRRLGDLFAMSSNDAIYPILDFAGYAMAISFSRAEVVRHPFIVEHHDRFPIF